jgi:hypothetical protein
MLTALALLLLAQTGPDALPRSLQQEEPPPRPESTTRSTPSTPVVDLDWLELTPAVGFAVYSPKYRANTAPALQVSARAPLPWLSPASDPKGEYFGVFAEAAFMNMERNLSPTVHDRSGLASFFSLGLDFSLLRDSKWIVVLRAGALYAYYGGIADLKSGFGVMAGASVGIQISGKMGLVYSPEFLFGDSGSMIFLNTLGLSIQF